jgi:hypothetical protein
VVLKNNIGERGRGMEKRRDGRTSEAPRKREAEGEGGGGTGGRRNRKEERRRGREREVETVGESEIRQDDDGMI